MSNGLLISWIDKNYNYDILEISVITWLKYNVKILVVKILLVLLCCFFFLNSDNVLKLILTNSDYNGAIQMRNKLTNIHH